MAKGKKGKAKPKRAPSRRASATSNSKAKIALKWAELISKAAVTPELRDRFLGNPRAVIAEFGIGLLKADDDRIPLIQEALRRFGGNAALNSEDAENWTVGLMHHTQNARCVPLPRRP